MASISTQHLQGSGISKLAQMVRKVGYNDFDRFELATVTSAPPTLKIKLDHSPLELEGSDLVIAEHLTEYTRTASVDGGADVSIVFRTVLSVSDRVIVVAINSGQTYVVLDKAVNG